MNNSIKLINNCLDSKYTKIHVDTSIKCSNENSINHSIILKEQNILLKNQN